MHASSLAPIISDGLEDFVAIAAFEYFFTGNVRKHLTEARHVFGKELWLACSGGEPLAPSIAVGHAEKLFEVGALAGMIEAGNQPSWFSR